ncbi:ATP-dependent DNA helicase RecG [Coriobacterium glomerans PW2]|uniref:ATP-dependent DNA helicase RecG n=1 Tax=Coriobacterium glomerans (strain ATCC 49209 / DSM 20642 / JCM 10262 / PW2) TaxID=700015 RepID=F2N9R5_CORGP|nr:ATP-dependent DNA helicase RecG [Coriobacterium glomerans]AEB07168.1 ATP-dependent DNA helicase RecG [Coriobacterium glomerans PW2]
MSEATCDFLVPPSSARIAHSSTWREDISRLLYVSGAREQALRRLGIERVGDLLSRIPYRYLDFSHAHDIESAPIGEVSTIVARVDRVVERRPRPRLSVTEISLVDATGVLQVAFFKQPWIARQIAIGDRLAVLGKIEFAYGFKQMTSPHYERLDPAATTGSILPVHKVSEGLSTAWMRRIISVALGRLGSFADAIPADLRARHGLMSAARAMRAIHFPVSFVERDAARRRLAYDEILILQLALRLRNDANLLGVRPSAHLVASHVRALRESLPFQLTDEQQRASDEILRDMADPDRIMNRLLLGDVGTGKTAVACIGLACVADTETQACVMAPTGVLAEQHAARCGSILDKAGVTWALLTGSTTPAERADIVSRLADGKLCVLFGTHAVLGEDVCFRHLSLVVIDEQHRFGVNQRNMLRAKGIGADLLVMTATPIPRTMALSVFGDLDTSVIRHRPIAGAGVATRVLSESSRDIAIGALRDAIARGEQAYVICPLVEPTDQGDDLEEVFEDEDARDSGSSQAAPLRNVEQEAERLRQVLGTARIARLHGRMPPREKDRVITAFRSGEIDVLVSTTVVEVGVDVGGATVMVIENGERFGLATLHQLRGRVGRGSTPGTCFILTRAAGKLNVQARVRLRALERTSDGFALAEMDLRLRHEGEILGLRQHGGVSLRYVDFDADTDLIEWAHDDAIELLGSSGGLRSARTVPLRLEVIDRYGDVFKEVSGG